MEAWKLPLDTVVRCDVAKSRSAHTDSKSIANFKKYLNIKLSKVNAVNARKDKNADNPYLLDRCYFL